MASGSECLACGTQYWSTPRLRMHLRKMPGCLAVYAGADLDFGPQDFVAATKGAWLPPVPSSTPRPWWATLRPPLADVSNVDPDHCFLTTPDISQAVRDMEGFEEDWAAFTSACRRVVQDFVNFDGSMDCASLGLEAGHRLYNCFTALLEVSHHLRLSVQHRGDVVEWSYAVVPPQFCLRYNRKARPTHVPAEEGGCVQVLAGKHGTRNLRVRFVAQTSKKYLELDYHGPEIYL